ncbi:MAG: hypothetical protein M9891_16130 [Austwickia sp.]|nr:hypothetical protein [Actinomycetota bacterium]MCB1254606.1 hypothetical protein [Austwickia sp.]MCO5310781.1 hypothetical protein [Austwickia sp.]
MGKGIGTSSGAEPLQAWQLRIGTFDSPQLSAVLRGLLGGDPVVSTDGAVEISVMPDGPLGRHRLSVRLPAAPFVADMVVTALPAIECHDPDERSSSPSPDQWMQRSARGPVTWELFNCRIHSLTSRRN